MQPKIFAQILIRTLALYLAWKAFEICAYAGSSWMTLKGIYLSGNDPAHASAQMNVAAWSIGIASVMPFVFAFILWFRAPRIAAFLAPEAADGSIPFTAQTAQRLIIQTIGVIFIAFSILELPQVTQALIAAKNPELPEKVAPENALPVVLATFFVKFIVGAGLTFAADYISRSFASRAVSGETVL